MEDNLVRLLQGSIDERGVAALARELGHGEGEVGSALSIVIPTFVSGLAHKAMTRGGAAEIMSALRNADERWLDDVPGSLAADRNRLSDEGSSILNLIFGRKLSSVLASVGSSTGLGKGGAGSLMRLHAPIALATVARHYRGRVEGERELSRELAAEGALAEAFLPRSLAPLLASEAPRVAASEPPPPSASTPRRRPTADVPLGARRSEEGPDRGGPGRFLIPAAIGAAILAAVLMFIGPRERAEDPALLGRPDPDEAAGLFDDAREDVDRAGERIRDDAREGAEETRELGREAEEDTREFGEEARRDTREFGREAEEETRDLGEEAKESLREGTRKIEEGADRVGERIGEAWRSTEESAKEGYEKLTEEGEEAAHEAEEEGRRAAESLEGRRRTLTFESSEFFQGQQSLELSETSSEALDEIAEMHAARESDRVTLRGPNPTQLDEIADALEERGVSGVGKEVDGNLKRIEVVFEP